MSKHCIVTLSTRHLVILVNTIVAPKKCSVITLDKALIYEMNHTLQL